ncbi:MAG TPA: biopolymer transporter ExbD [Gemmatimonadales bacterium]|nr:biopolymer transporter ExbD [Gemmatimonadales bacterium]
MALSATSSKAAVKADINVTPMIDVMLVLLIIFMIVTPIITAGFQATLPRGQNPESRPEGPEEIILGISQTGQFYLDVGQGARPIADEALPGRLTEIYATRTKDKIMYLKADQGIPFGRVQQAIEIARKAGVRVIGAIAEQRQQVFRRGREGGH